jgi:hypothetical protein
LQTIIASILNYYQEQIIFEEALVILQEKGVDLENLFLYAYERLKINMEETAEDKVALDADPSFTVVTDVSLPSSFADVDRDGDGDESFDEEQCPKFS